MGQRPYWFQLTISLFTFYKTKGAWGAPSQALPSWLAKARATGGLRAQGIPRGSGACSLRTSQGGRGHRQASVGFNIGGLGVGPRSQWIVRDPAEAWVSDPLILLCSSAWARRSLSYQE